MPLEKEFMKECGRTLGKFGWATKLVQDSVMCLNCHRPVHPVHKGWADYHVEIKTDCGPIAMKVECKGGRDRYNFDQIKPEQRAWLLDWEERTGGVSWIWLQLGDKRVGSANAMARRVWMVPTRILFRREEEIREVFNLNYLPINIETALANNMRLKHNPYNAETLFSAFSMEWQSDNLWKPNRSHPIWETMEGMLTYDGFNTPLPLTE